MAQTKINSALQINQGARLLGLSEKSKTSLIYKLSKVKPIIIDEHQSGSKANLLGSK